MFYLLLRRKSWKLFDSADSWNEISNLLTPHKCIYATFVRLFLDLYTLSFLFSVKTPTMDVVTSFLVVVQVLFFIQHVPLYNVSGQPLYNNPRTDSLKDSEAYFNYQKIFGTEITIVCLLYFYSRICYAAQINHMQWHDIYIFRL